MCRNKDVLARMPPFAPPSGRGLTKGTCEVFWGKPNGHMRMLTGASRRLAKTPQRDRQVASSITHCGDPSAAHGHSSPWRAAQCSPQHSNNPVSAFILAMTVALLQPTNPLFNPTAYGTHLPERPCNGQHNTGWPLRHACESASTIIMHI